MLSGSRNFYYDPEAGSGKRGDARFDVPLKNPVIILRDATPLDEGGFSPGTEIATDEFEMMLMNKSLVPGTLIRKGRNKRVPAQVVVLAGRRLELAPITWNLKENA